MMSAISGGGFGDCRLADLDEPPVEVQPLCMELRAESWASPEEPRD